MRFWRRCQGRTAADGRRAPRRQRSNAYRCDGDLQLQWTTAGSGARFAAIVHHTDEAREYAYDRQSKIGKLDQALNEAGAKGWAVVDMKQDWKTVFPEK